MQVYPDDNFTVALLIIFNFIFNASTHPIQILRSTTLKIPKSIFNQEFFSNFFCLEFENQAKMLKIPDFCSQILEQ